MKWTMLAAEAGDVPSRIHLHPTLFTLHPHTLHPTPYTLSLSIFLTPSHSLTTAGAMKWTTLAAEAGDVPSVIHLHPTLFTLHPHTLYPTPYTLYVSLSILLTHSTLSLPQGP